MNWTAREDSPEGGLMAGLDLDAGLGLVHAKARSKSGSHEGNRQTTPVTEWFYV